MSHNTRELTKRCLRSLFAFARDLRIEVIVVENASEDGTAHLVREEFPDVRLIENATNVGFARACNQGLRRARGRYVMLLNSDTEFCADVLSPLLRRLEAHPEVGTGARSIAWVRSHHRVLFIHPSPHLTGAGRMLALLTKHLRRRGHETLVVLPEAGPLMRVHGANEVYLRELQQLARALGVEARLRFADEPEDAHYAYGATDLVIATSPVEAFGLIPLEGLAAGKPVISVRTAIAEQLQARGYAVRVVSPTDPEELARAVVETLAAFPQTEATPFPEDYRAERVVAQFEVAYAELLAKRPDA